jgi:hypothetical protein
MAAVTGLFAAPWVPRRVAIGGAVSPPGNMKRRLAHHASFGRYK